MGRHKITRPEQEQAEPRTEPQAEPQAVPPVQPPQVPAQPEQKEKPMAAEEPRPMTENEKLEAAMRHFRIKPEDMLRNIPVPKANGVKFLDDGRVKLYTRKGTFIWTTRLKPR